MDCIALFSRYLNNTVEVGIIFNNTFYLSFNKILLDRQLLWFAQLSLWTSHIISSRFNVSIIFHNYIILDSIIILLPQTFHKATHQSTVLIQTLTCVVLIVQPTTIQSNGLSMTDYDRAPLMISFVTVI